MTNQEKLLSYVILGISKGLLGEFDEVPDEPSSTKTATRLAELTKATEVVVEHQLGIENRLARLEDELRALRADLKEYTLIAAMRPPATAEPPLAPQSMPTTKGVARVEEVESREQLRHLADLVDCVRVQRGISRGQMAQSVGWPVEILGEVMRKDLAILARAAEMVSETSPLRMHAPLAPYASLSSPSPKADLPSPPPKAEPTRRSSKSSKPAKQGSKGTKPAKQSSKRSSKKQPKAQATADKAPVVEPRIKEVSDTLAEGMSEPKNESSGQTATGETVVRLRAKGGRR